MKTSLITSGQTSRIRLGRALVGAGLALTGLFYNHNAFAYYSTIDSGELVVPNSYQVGIEAQGIMHEFSGMNFVGRFDAGINESSSVRGLLGFGKVDFQIGGFYKYIPYPDTPHQPAIGGEAGVIVSRFAGDNQIAVRLHPLISKKFQSEVGDFIPYASIPFGVTFGKGPTVIPVQFVVGSEFRPLDLKNFSFFAELGIEVSKSFSYLSVAGAWRFDDGTIRR